jgi:CDP-diacylglycerol--serine O-phosphatidyltransferase
LALLAHVRDPNRERPRRRRLKSLAFAPTLATLGNLICGFAAIHFCSRAMFDLGAGMPKTPIASLHTSLLEFTPPSLLSLGAWLIFMGMVFDILDGLIARVTRSTTNFGGQLDSLADMVSFGIAPATLMVAFMTQELAGESILPSPMSEHFVGRATWVSAAIYVAFTAVRLARFNVEHARADFDYRTFRGMPSPAAAAIVAALILFQDQMGGTVRTIAVYSLPVVAIVAAGLMVSRVPYRRFHRAYFLGRKPFSQVMTAVMLLAVFLLIKAPIILLIVLWYGASGPVFLALRFLRDRRRVRASGAVLETETADTERKLA